MRPLKFILRTLAMFCFGISFAIRYWPWLLLSFCLLSPISLHVRIPEQWLVEPCAYLGVRGVAYDPTGPCSDLRLIDTRHHEELLW